MDFSLLSRLKHHSPAHQSANPKLCKYWTAQLPAPSINTNPSSHARVRNRNLCRWTEHIICWMVSSSWLMALACSRVCSPPWNGLLRVLGWGFVSHPMSRQEGFHFRWDCLSSVVLGPFFFFFFFSSFFEAVRVMSTPRRTRPLKFSLQKRMKKKKYFRVLVIDLFSVAKEEARSLLCCGGCFLVNSTFWSCGALRCST